MIEMLMRPIDETHNQHKKKQLRELAAINGTLKDEAACILCGETTHRSEHCPKKTTEVYVLPSNIQAKVDALYERDVARMGHSTAGMESEYQSFLKELGGAPPPEMMGEVGGGGKKAWGGGAEGPDECKLYVGGLPASFLDAQLTAMFEPFGTITHAVSV
jgi:splicing factor 1